MRKIVGSCALHTLSTFALSVWYSLLPMELKTRMMVTRRLMTTLPPDLIRYHKLTQSFEPSEDQVHVEMPSTRPSQLATPRGISNKGSQLSRSSSNSCNSCKMCAQGGILFTTCLGDFVSCAWYVLIPHRMQSLLNDRFNSPSIISWLSPITANWPSTRFRLTAGR